MSDNLTFFAGETARSLIKENGLDPSMVRVIAGAAGGPKFLVLSQIDQYLLTDWFANTENPVDLVGSSIGALRFAALAMKQPQDAYQRLLNAYINQKYKNRPSRKEVSAESSKIIDAFLADEGVSEIIANKSVRLNVLSVKCRWPNSSDNRLLLGLGLMFAYGGNMVSRKSLGGFFKRALFYHPAQHPPFLQESDIPIVKIPLSETNLRLALQSSGSIPFVMSGVTDISDAPKGTYRDGGLVDYHLDIPYNLDNKGIVLFPHYTDKVTPGWLDKKLTWRKPNRQHMSNVLMISPSQRFIGSLPYGKIPDRNDFFKFEGQDNDRISYWQTVRDKSKVLAEELHQVISGDINDSKIKPLPG